MVNTIISIVTMYFNVIRFLNDGYPMEYHN